MIQVNVGSSIREATNSNPVVTTDGASVAEVISRMDERYPGFARRMISGSGQLRSNIQITCGSQAVDLSSPLNDGDILEVRLRDVPGG